MTDEDLRTSVLGRYGDFESEIVVEILTDAGIKAFHRHDPEDNDHVVYNSIFESDRGVVMVDSSREAEARALVAEELPKHLASIAEAMETIDVDDPSGGAQPESGDGEEADG